MNERMILVNFLSLLYLGTNVIWFVVCSTYPRKHEAHFFSKLHISMKSVYLCMRIYVQYDFFLT